MPNIPSQYFSREGLEKLKKELEERTSILRSEIANRIKEAKELGDLAENAEYEAAKEAQAVNEGRVEELKNVLSNAVIINGNNGSSGVVNVGSSIRVESTHGVQHFVIVGAAESDPTAGFISNESPLGQAFLGKKKNEKVEVKTPKGGVEYKILEIK
jgi:transcription elongation factor GreA